MTAQPVTTLPRAFLTRPIAHRALHDVARGLPENSRVAIRAAMDHGYGIEIDLQPSRDDVAMVFHDYDMKRLTGVAGPLRQKSAQELGAMRLLGGDEGIPTLAEVLDLVAGRVPLLIELKDQHGQMGETCGTLEAATLRALESYSGPVALMSFNPHMVARMGELAPHLPRGIVGCGYRADNWPLLREDARARLRGLPDAERVGAAFISQNWHDLDNPRIAALRDRGLGILCWTIRSPRQEAVARQRADNVTFEGYLAA